MCLGVKRQGAGFTLEGHGLEPFSMLPIILAADFDFIPQVHHKRIWQS
jgi:hypothetical protein